MLMNLLFLCWSFFFLNPCCLWDLFNFKLLNFEFPCHECFFLMCQSEGHRQILTKELEAVGLRLNKRPPQVSLCMKGYFWIHDMKPIFYVGSSWIYMLFLINLELYIYADIF